MKICSIAFIDDVLGKGSEIEENENSDLPQKNAHLYILAFGAVCGLYTSFSESQIGVRLCVICC